jgi:hypothetical protein
MPGEFVEHNQWPLYQPHSIESDMLEAKLRLEPPFTTVLVIPHDAICVLLS